MRRYVFFALLAVPVTLVIGLSTMFNLSNGLAPDMNKSPVESCSSANASAYMDYLTSRCVNTLFNTTQTISKLGCATFGAWIANCVWEVNFANHSAIYSASSQSGGLKYNKASQISQSNLNAINPQVGANGDVVTVIYEGETNPGKHDIFLVNSTDGGEHFGGAVNLSNSPDKDSVNSILRVDPSSLNVLIVWIEKSSANSTDDSVRAYCSRC